LSGPGTRLPCAGVMTKLRVSLLALVLLAAGCGSSKEKPASTPVPQTATATTAPATPTATPTAAPKATAKTLAPVSKDLSKEPIVQQPTGSPPSGLLVKDIVVGKGRKAKPGDNLSVQYTGYSFSNGQKFDASWDRGGQPFEFPLGAGQVIQGW